MGNIKHLDNMREKHYDHNCGGELYLDSRIFLEQSEVLNAGSYFGRVTFIPGSSMGYHEQNCNPAGDLEVFYMIEGELVATLNGEKDTLRPGDIMYCYNGDWNGLENLSDKNAVVLVMIYRSPDRKEQNTAKAVKNLVSSEYAPAAAGPYSQAIEAKGVVYASGQLPIAMNGEIPEGIEEQTRTSIRNLTEVLRAAGCTLNDVVKTTVFLTDIADFGVVNGIYGEYFSKPYPGRSCYQVAALPKGALVEIEAIAVRPE